MKSQEIRSHSKGAVMTVDWHFLAEWLRRWNVPESNWFSSGADSLIHQCFVLFVLLLTRRLLPQALLTIAALTVLNIASDWQWIREKQLSLSASGRASSILTLKRFYTWSLLSNRYLVDHETKHGDSKSSVWEIWPRCPPEHLLHSPASPPPHVLRRCGGRHVVGALGCSQTASRRRGSSGGAVCLGTCRSSCPVRRSARSQRTIFCETPAGSDRI